MRIVVTRTVSILSARPRPFVGAVACVLGLALSAPVWAQVTWDADTGTSGAQDGSGTWSTANANWWNGTSDVVWPNLTTSTATIGANSGAAGTITVDGSLTLNAITFNAPGSGSYTVTGGTLGFAGTSPTITANTAATIASDITSGGGLTKGGTGTLALSGLVTNTSGAVSVSRGEVELTGTLTNTSTSTLAVGSSNGGTLTIAGGSLTTSSSSGARSIVIAGGAGRTGTVAVESGSLSTPGLYISEDSGGNGVFTQSGGTVSVGGSNIWISGNTSSLTVSGGSFTTSGATTYLAVGSTFPSTSTINVSGSGSITLNRLQFGISGRNGFTATVNVGDGNGGGTLQLNTGFAWSGATSLASTINFDSGTFVANNTFSIPAQIATVVKAGANISVSTSQTLTMPSPLTDGGGGGGLTKLGPGTLSLTGANTFTGATRIGGGSLSLGNALALQNSTLDLDDADTGSVSAIGQNSTLGGLAGSRDLDMRTRTLSIGNNGGSTTYSGALSNGALTKIGAGTLTLTGTNAYTGATTIDSGTLQIGAGGTSGAIAGTSTITGSAGARLVFSRTDNYGGNVANNIGGGLALTLNSGTLTLTGSNSYSGATAINGGVLGLGAAGALGGAGDIVFGGGTLQFSASNAGDYAARIKNSGSAIAVDTNGQNVTFAGTLDSSNTGGLVKVGTGTLTLSGSNAYTGGTTLTGGGFVISNVNGWGSGDVTYNVDANTTTAFSLPTSGTIANNITINKPGADRRYTFQQNQSNDVTFSGNITLASGNGPTFSLSGVSSGTFTLTGNNSFGADVFTGAGVTMRIGGTNAAGGRVWRPNLAANMVMLDGADFKSVIGNAIASYSMEAAGTATVSNDVFNRNTANVAVNLPANAELRFTGVLRAEGGSTTGTYTKTGVGTWVVNNTANQMTFNVLEGALQVPAFTAIGPSSDAAFLVLSGGTLRHAGAASSTTKAFTLGASGGSLDASGSGTAAFTSAAAVAFTGSGNRTLTLTGTNTGSNTLGLTLSDHGADVVSLAKAGAGTWVLSGSNNTYTGATTVESGTLAIGVNNAISGSSPMTIGSATTVGTLALGDFTQTTASLSFSGLGGTLAAAAGTLVMQGLGGGNAALSVGADAQATIGATLSLASPTDVDVAAGRTLQLAALSGANSLTKTGAGALTLTGGGHAGGFDIQAGRLNINAASAIGNATSLALGSGIELDNASAGAVTINNNGVAISLGSSLTFLGTQDLNMGGGAVTLGASSAIDVQAGTLTFGGNVVDGGSGYGITKDGGGTLVLSGLAAGAFSGNSVINAGELHLSGTSTLGGGSGATLTLNPGGTLRIGGDASTGGVTIVDNGGTKVVETLQNSGQIFAVSATLAAGDALFNGVQTIGGSVTVSASQDWLGSIPASPTAGRIVMENAAVLASTNAIDINVNKGITLAGASATFDTSAGTIFVRPVISGSGQLVKVGSEGFRLYNTGNDYTGGTVARDGTLGIFGDGSLGAVSGALLLDGGTVNSAQGTSGQTVTIDAARVVQLVNGKTSGLAATNGSTLAYAGVLAEAAAGTAAGLRIGTATQGGTVLLGGVNTYAGDTTIAGGTLKLGSGGSFANSPRIIVGDAAGSPGATLDLSDKNLFSIGSTQTLMGKGRVVLGQNTALTINGLFSPGNSPGLFTYDGGSTTLSGTTLMEIWGTVRAANPGYDAVNVINSGLLTLGGILELNFDQNFADLASFTLFDTLTSGSLAGGFGSIAITGVNNDYVGLSFTQEGNVWTTGFNGNNQGLRLTQTASDVTLDVIVVPEPGTALFAGIGIAMAGWLLRNRRRAAP